MSRDVILTCAVTGGGDTAGKSKAVPVTPEEIANSSIEAARAGAAIVHIHVRDPATGKPSMDGKLYAEVVERIRASDVDVLINLTTGAGARFIPDADDPKRGGQGTTMTAPGARVAHVEALKPDVCSLDIATMNFGEHAFVNTAPHLRLMAERIHKAGVMPELEVFDVGHLRLARSLLDDAAIKQPVLFQLCLGIPWGAPATPEMMMFLRNMLPNGALWSGFGIGPQQMPMVAQAVLLGGHCRVGLEDNLYLERGVLAPSNAALVQKAVDIIRVLGDRPATPQKAREMLSAGRADRHN